MLQCEIEFLILLGKKKTFNLLVYTFLYFAERAKENTREAIALEA